MNTQYAYIFALACGLAAMATGAVYYRRGGKGLMFLGAAITIGPLASLLDGRISEEAQIAMSIASVILSFVGVAVTVRDSRARQRRIASH